MNRRGERPQDKSKVSSIYKSHGGVINYHYPNQNMLTDCHLILTSGTNMTHAFSSAQCHLNCEEINIAPIQRR